MGLSPIQAPLPSGTPAGPPTGMPLNPATIQVGNPATIPVGYPATIPVGNVPATIPVGPAPSALRKGKRKYGDPPGPGFGRLPFGVVRSFCVLGSNLVGEGLEAQKLANVSEGERLPMRVQLVVDLEHVH